MNTAAGSSPRTPKVRVTKSEIIAHPVAGRGISVPLAWSWQLPDAAPAQRAGFRLIGAGQGEDPACWIAQALGCGGAAVPEGGESW
jgi:hypothetical protein